MNTSIFIRFVALCICLLPSTFVHSESLVRVSYDTAAEESHTSTPRSKHDGKSAGLWNSLTRTPVRSALTSIVLISGVTPLLSAVALCSKLGAVGCGVCAVASLGSGHPGIAVVSVGGAATLGITAAASAVGATVSFMVGIGAAVKCLVLCAT